MSAFDEWISGWVGARSMPPIVFIPPNVKIDGRVSLVSRGLVAELHAFPEWPDCAIVLQGKEMLGTTAEREALARRKGEDEFR